MPKTKGMIAATTAVALLLAAGRAETCSFPGPQPLFVYGKHPDMPLGPFARGGLGVLLPTFARSYLVAAYRHLLGTGFDAKEQEALLTAWSSRIGAAAVRSEALSYSSTPSAFDLWRVKR